MKKYSLLFSFFLSPFAVLAQCSFNPTVFPDNLILCPNVTDTLWTQPYDAYQWYKNNSLLPGATNQFYVVNSAGDEYSVAATLDTCTELSPQVLVDGWVFLLPYVIESGDGYFDPDLYAIILCHGDTFILTMGSPNTTNVQWFNNGDSIPGATGTDLFITESGVYTACGAPDICPGFIQCLGVDIAVMVMNPTPVITQSNDTLSSNTTAVSYQWYFNGNMISGATDYFYVPAATGEYTVGVNDVYGCSGTSLPYSFIATFISLPQNSFELFPTITRDLIFINCEQRISSVTIYDELGNTVLSPGISSNYIHVSELQPGVYFLRAQFSEGVICRKFIRY